MNGPRRYARWLALALGALILATAFSPAEARSRRQRKRRSADRVQTLLIGDSLMATELGAYLQWTLKGLFRSTCKRRARSSSGLSRPDFYHWPRKAQSAMRRHRPDVVFVLLGTNDAQNIRQRRLVKKRWRRRWVRWASPGWATAYRKQVQALLTGLERPNRQVIWLSIPPMANRWLDHRLQHIRKLQREVVTQHGRHSLYLDIYPMLRPTDGRRGFRRLRRYRHRDGIHFNWKGSRRLVRRIYPLLATTLSTAVVQRYLTNTPSRPAGG